jgi:hypothetical protein
MSVQVVINPIGAEVSSGLKEVVVVATEIVPQANPIA